MLTGSLYFRTQKRRLPKPAEIGRADAVAGKRQRKGMMLALEHWRVLLMRVVVMVMLARLISVLKLAMGVAQLAIGCPHDYEWQHQGQYYYEMCEICGKTKARKTMMELREEKARRKNDTTK